ncbi:MAG: metal-dependent transcriptional regulator [Chloroflexi bacterium]|nr:metal-dependent transcriptional regulator [Chloroflexota bacterium]
MYLGERRPEISTVVENYLQAVYKLQERGERVFLSRLADAVHVSAATVVGMLKRLAAQGLVQVTESKEITLTRRGTEIAESVVRRHRLAERMLVELLGIAWHRAHEEAHRFEHAISPHVEEKLAQVLGYPATCPFGNPIPGYGGQVSPPDTRPLSEATGGEEGTIERVPEEDQQLLEFFEANNLKPGVAVHVKEVAPYKGTVTLSIGGQDVVLGTQVAAAILVRAPGAKSN